jgi:hypothetical protein
LSTGYTVSLNANQDTSPGGTITLTAGALATGYTLTITSAIPNTQPTQFINQGGFYPETLNGALDRLTILIQQLQTAVSQSVKNLTYYPAAPVISGSTYQAPGNVAAVFVNGAAQSTTDYSVNGSHLITFNYTLNGSDVVYALCTS